MAGADAENIYPKQGVSCRHSLMIASLNRPAELEPSHRIVSASQRFLSWQPLAPAHVSFGQPPSLTFQPNSKKFAYLHSRKRKQRREKSREADGSVVS